MSLLYKGIGLVLICLIITLIFGKKSEYAFFVSSIGVLLVAALILSRISPYLKQIENTVTGETGIAEYFKTAIKCTGIALITQTVSNVCKDYNQTSLSSAAELMGKGIIFALCTPLFLNVLDVATKFLKL